MANTPIAANLGQALDVQRDLAAQITLNLVLTVNNLT
jgi:hypothetical protein